MSLAIKVSRAGGLPSMYGYGRGDPGLFGFIGSALKSVGKAAIGAVTGFASGGPLGAITGGVRAVVPGIRDSRMTTMTTLPIPLSQTLPVSKMGTGISIGGSSGVQIGSFPQVGPGGNTTQSGVSGPLVGQTSHVPCAGGYHHNKHGYYTKKYGYIEKGTVCVKNRRRNPLNPRALSRALSRLHSARKAVRALKIIERPRSTGCAPRRRGKCR